jgi:hypothetical protein
MPVAAVSGVAGVDAADLVALARDPRRHAFLLRTTGSDYAAQAEIAAAQRHLAGQDEPDLRALLELAVYRNAMSLRNQCLPFALPGVWARLGRLDHAEALARAVAQAGDPDRARDLLALALSTDSPEIVWWMEALTECFPDVVRDVRDMFLMALVPGGSAEQLAGDD